MDEPWPGHPYTSHNCQFDVFPRFDPVRTKFDGMTIKADSSLVKKIVLDFYVLPPLPSTVEDSFFYLSLDFHESFSYNSCFIGFAFRQFFIGHLLVVLFIRGGLK